MINIDDTNYNADWEFEGFEQTADILSGSNSGRLQGTGSMHIEPIGTFFNSNGPIVRSSACTDIEWNSLYRVLSNPLNTHTVKIPFDDGYLTTEVYISQAKRKLISAVKINGTYHFVWDNSYDVTFTSVDSQWLAGGALQGYTEGI